MTSYLSDREGGEPARIQEDISAVVWSGLYALITKRLLDHSFGYRYPDQCLDGYGVCGHSDHLLRFAVAAELHDLPWPLQADEPPTLLITLDLLEFTAASIGKPIQGSFHSHFRHHHLTFDHNKGRQSFVADVNALFARNGIAYEMSGDGAIRRIPPVGLREMLLPAVFNTGDRETDRLLETARRQVLLPDEDSQRDALEKLWDAFERLKTLEPGSDKRAQTDALLDHAMKHSQKFRQLLASEAKALTDAGNTYRIRHSETTQKKLETATQNDYLLTRMFSFIRSLLRQTGRGG